MIDTVSRIEKELNELYSALFCLLPDHEFESSEIAKQAVIKINSFGPFEISPFESCDIVSMLNHLCCYDFLEIKATQHVSRGGRIEGNTIKYKKKEQHKILQNTLFE